jgi:phosphoribosylformylglycinamidine synthase subunit PurS
MKFFAEVNVMPLKALLDPQGKAVNNSMHNIGFRSVTGLRIGKHITFEIHADDAEKAKAKVDEACQKILTNPIMEGYEFTVKEIE